MNAEHHDAKLDDLIHTAIGRDSVPFDFQRWKQRHRDQIKTFQSQIRQSHSQGIALVDRRLTMIRTLKIAAAAVIFLGVCLGVPFLNRHSESSTAVAQIVEQIERAQTVTWQFIVYNQVTSKDGERMWIQTEIRQQAYKAPGLYRDATFDKTGQIHHWTVTDAINMREISVNPAKQRATVRELATGADDPRGPFVWVKEAMAKHNLEWVGRRTMEAGEVNVFRTAFQREDNNRDWSYDFWVDVKTKRLVALYVPGADIYDPEHDARRNNPREDTWSVMEPVCSAKYDIDFDAEVDHSLFSLEPPPGYSTETEQRAYVTEAQMIEYLGVMADYNDKTFPDQPYSVDGNRLNEIGDKAKEDRTPAEQKLLDTVDSSMMAGLNMLPTGHFIEDHTVKGTFRYLGKGVKLGDADRIVCWYKLKYTGVYRAVYGDLSVRDIAPEDLPLPVEP
jgi:hypothetical protein